MKIKTINSVEISSVCDNACVYCPCKDQGAYRDVGLMQIETFEKTIEWVSKFCKDKTQLELNLFGVGEPMLHPRVVQFVAYARQHLPFQHDIHLNTNGNTMTMELAQSLKDAGITQIDVTGHDHRATANTVRIFRRLRIPHNVSHDFAIAPNNWAGQVDWFTPEYEAGPCPWICRGQVMVMSNGDVTTCCIDAFGKNILGNVFDDDLSELDVKYSKLCKSCHHTVPDALQRT
jgi:sulfatase maturation enzyme AslB (radical SAM superfamily)